MRDKTLNFLIVMSLIPLVVSPFLQPFNVLLSGLKDILFSRSILITDYLEVGGVGATLFNVGFIMMMSIVLIVWSKAAINGTAIASVFLMGSFAFFGKNIVNVLPILLGTFVYAKVTKEPYKDIVHMSLLATSFAPVFNELLRFGDDPLYLRFLIATAVGMSCGFLIKPITRHVLKIHEGFNLYNTGFSIGILASIYVALMKSFGYIPNPQLILYTGNTGPFIIILLIMFTGFLATAFIMDPTVYKSYWALLKEDGYINNDFLQRYGLPTVLMNMAMNGYLVLGYVLIIAKGELTGPIIGGIFTVLGFSGLGKHVRNITPILVGVILGSLTKNWSINAPGTLLAALFGTALAPISGYFGFIWGVLASYLNSSMALSSSQLHGGLNLYNTGFSSGIVAIFLVPLLKKFVKPDPLE